MKAKQSLRALMLIFPLLFMASCKDLPSESVSSEEILLAPSDYEIDAAITH